MRTLVALDWFGPSALASETAPMTIARRAMKTLHWRMAGFNSPRSVNSAPPTGNRSRDAKWAHLVSDIPATRRFSVAGVARG